MSLVRKWECYKKTHLLTTNSTAKTLIKPQALVSNVSKVVPNGKIFVSKLSNIAPYGMTKAIVQTAKKDTETNPINQSMAPVLYSLLLILQPIWLSVSKTLQLLKLLTSTANAILNKESVLTAFLDSTLMSMQVARKYLWIAPKRIAMDNAQDVLKGSQWRMENVWQKYAISLYVWLLMLIRQNV